MQTFRRIALLALPLLARVACEETPASPTKKTDNRPEAYYSSPNEAFQDLLNALPEESLHVALNSLEHFKNGVFESDRHGVERVHHENPPLATRLIIAAVQDLKKRQDPAPTNGTSQTTPTPGSSSDTPPPASSSAAPPPPASSAPASSAPVSSAPASNAPASSAPPSSAASAVIVPVPVQTTDAQGKPTVLSSEILSQPTASVAVPVTRTNAAGQTEVATETKPAVIFTASDGSLTTSAVDFAPTPGQVMTRTDSKGSTFLTTYTPDGGKVSSILLLTTTVQDGKPSVITSYAFVDPAQTPTNANANPTKGSTAKPGLQSGAAVRNKAAEAAMMGGALGGAFAFFI